MKPREKMEKEKKNERAAQQSHDQATGGSKPTKNNRQLARFSFHERLSEAREAKSTLTVKTKTSHKHSKGTGREMMRGDQMMTALSSGRSRTQQHCYTQVNNIFYCFVFIFQTCCGCNT